MAYKYIPAGDSIHLSPKDTYRRDIQAQLDEYFYVSSDWYQIQEETGLATGVYQNVDARINKVVTLQTGERVGDDFKKLLFKEIDHSVDLGRYYQFANNYWITVNVDKVNTLTQSVTVKRCNNTLRWMDDNGGLFEVPCSIGYLIKENRDYSTAGSQMVVPSGMIEITVQRNSLTDTLKPNQRFLFGNSRNWTAYRLEGGGINNFNNAETLNMDSAGLLKLSIATDFLNPQTDDLVNGIADVRSYVYALSLNQDAVFGDVGTQIQLQATVTVNGEIVIRTVEWASSDTSVFTVDSNGMVTFVAEGSATVTCSLRNNASVNGTCTVEVGSTPIDNYQVIYSPSKNSVLESENQIWTVHLYKNNVEQPDAFVFSLDANTVPSDHYVYEVIDGNSFKITNQEMFLTDTLDVTCTSGLYSTVISVSLKGVW